MFHADWTPRRLSGLPFNSCSYFTKMKFDSTAIRFWYVTFFWFAVIATTENMWTESKPSTISVTKRNDDN